MTIKRAFLLFAALLAIFTARPYASHINGGIVWNWGGVEVYGEPGIFVCRSALTPWGVDC